MEIRVGLLAIGNEVVEGQITNSNGAWLAQQLEHLGFESLYHLSTRDNLQEIDQALDFLKKSCQLILISGGLGPTRDDLTRQAVAQWTGCELQLNKQQLVVIEGKLKSRGVTLRESHQQQALLPNGALPLQNANGVAPGFYLNTDGLPTLASLPGPPSELKKMFDDSLAPLLKKDFTAKRNFVLRTWICLGAPESEISHVTESLVGDQFQLGFRLHKPYVEVKIWVPLNPTHGQIKVLDRISEKLKPWFVGDSIPKIRESFHQHLKNFDFVFIIDHLSGGLFLDKLREEQHSDHIRYQCFEHKSYRLFSKDEVSSILKVMVTPDKANSLFIALFPRSENSAWLAFNKKIEAIEIPRNISIQSQLGRLYVIEKCFLKA